MKKILFVSFAAIILMLSSCRSYRVYSISDRPVFPAGGGVVYALPQTLLRVAVTVEHRDCSKAPFLKYAIDYIGVDSTCVKSAYRISDIDVQTVNVADPSHYYFVKVRRGSVAVNDNHLLLSIGNGAKGQTPALSEYPSYYIENRPASSNNASYNLYDREDTLYTRHDRPGHPSLVLTGKDVRSISQQAEASAALLGETQQRIRELVGGEYDGNYSPETVKNILSELRRQENEIISLFCGTVKRETVFFYINPLKLKRSDFCDTVTWFSESDGFVGDEESRHADAYPVVCTVSSNNELSSVERFMKYHSSGLTLKGKGGRTGTSAHLRNNRRTFLYRIPEMSVVYIDASTMSMRRTIPISQYGPIIELPTGNINATFDPATFNLLSIEK